MLGAALFVDPDARRQVLKPLSDRRLRHYMGKHSNALARYASEHGLRNGLLVLTGWVKTSAWASTAFLVEKKLAGSLQTSVKFQSQLQPEWTPQLVDGTLVRYKSGPYGKEANSDQCIFISYYLLTSRLLFFKSLKASAGPDNQPGRDPEDDSIPPAVQNEEGQPVEPHQVCDNSIQVTKY